MKGLEKAKLRYRGLGGAAAVKGTRKVRPMPGKRGRAWGSSRYRALGGAAAVKGTRKVRPMPEEKERIFLGLTTGRKVDGRGRGRPIPS